MTEPVHVVAYAVAQAVSGGDPEGTELGDWVRAVLAVSPNPDSTEAVAALEGRTLNPQEWKVALLRRRIRRYSAHRRARPSVTEVTAPW
jgi:hypothetical protein